MTPALLLVAVEEGDVKAGPIGLVIILLMLIATFLLIRNMNGRIKRLPTSFEDAPPDDAAPEPEDRTRP